MMAFRREGWWMEYVKSFGTLIDWVRISADGCVLLFLWLYGLKATEYPIFLCVFALCAFYKWVMILNALVPFRAFGLNIIPILHTMLDVGPFVTVLAFHVLGLMHGYTSLSVPGIDMFESGMLVYRLGVMGDIHPDEMDGGVKEYYYVTRVFFFVVAFLVTVTLMNTFIAALGNSYSINSDKMEILFQYHRAERVLSHMAIREGVMKLLGRSTLGSKQENVWYCCAAESEILGQ